jgi:hypothetical protein
VEQTALSLLAKREWKTTTIVINVIQQLVCEGEQSPRALIIVEDKAKVLRWKTFMADIRI